MKTYQSQQIMQRNMMRIGFYQKMQFKLINFPKNEMDKMTTIASKWLSMHNDLML